MPQKCPKNGLGNKFNSEADEYASITALRSCNLLQFAPLRLVCVCVVCAAHASFALRLMSWWGMRGRPGSLIRDLFVRRLCSKTTQSLFQRQAGSPVACCPAGLLPSRHPKFLLPLLCCLLLFFGLMMLSFLPSWLQMYRGQTTTDDHITRAQWNQCSNCLLKPMRGHLIVSNLQGWPRIQSNPRRSAPRKKNMRRCVAFVGLASLTHGTFDASVPVGIDSH